MTQVGEELNEEIDKWCENRSSWVNNRVKGCIAQMRCANRNDCHMRKKCGVADERTKRVKDIYLRKKEEARPEVGRDLHVDTGMVMKKLIAKRNETNDSNLKLINEDGKTIADEKKVKDID